MPRHPRQDELRAHHWLYPFELPDGEVVQTIEGGTWNILHTTRSRMMDAVLERTFAAGLAGLTAIDLACNQGYFGMQLARRGCKRVLGVDARQVLVDQARLMATVIGLENYAATRADIHELDPAALGRFDVVLVLGLLYHLENPIGAIRTAHALTGRVCFIETQLMPPAAPGPIDWGSERVKKPVHGAFGVIDETHEVDCPLASMRGISLVPSLEALVWIMQAVGFKQVTVLPPPADGWEQLVSGKRAMVAGFR
jgi:hypothetical protein